MFRGVAHPDVVEEIEVGEAPGKQFVMRERSQPGEGLELRVDLAATELHPEDVDQLFMSLDQARIAGEGLPEVSLGRGHAISLPFDPARHEKGLRPPEGHPGECGRVRTRRLRGGPWR